ncbi:hypothetical protein YC2023_069197 [Brassica napus]
MSDVEAHLSSDKDYKSLCFQNGLTILLVRDKKGDESPVRFINAATSRGSSKSSLQLRQTRDSPICRPFVLDPPLKWVSSDLGILEWEEIR